MSYKNPAADELRHADWVMNKIRESQSTDAEVVDILQGCCRCGVEVWKKHATEYLEADGGEKTFDAAAKARLGGIEANNDTSERQIAMIRYLRTTMQRLRVAGKEAQLMLMLNKPLGALHAGKFGSVSDVLQLVRKRQRLEAKQRGTLADEMEAQNKEELKYRSAEGQKEQTARGAAVAETRAKNKSAAEEIVAEFNVDSTALLQTKAQVEKMNVGMCNTHMAAWKLVGKLDGAAGYGFRAVFPTEGTGAKDKKTGKKGMKLPDKQKAIIAVIKLYRAWLAATLGRSSGPQPGGPVAEGDAAR